MLILLHLPVEKHLIRFKPSNGRDFRYALEPERGWSAVLCAAQEETAGALRTLPPSRLVLLSSLVACLRKVYFKSHDI